ncbi:hypothetical protein ABIB57_001956 [Devosia sp. UYZn731]|uniref:hypothetical protein n=1 Tax=Devosia sp. UYZn731 TaxID=3156345 RepID=UPI00339B996D
MLDELVIRTGSLPSQLVEASRNHLFYAVHPRARSDDLIARIADGLLHSIDRQAARALGLEIEELVRSTRNEVERVRLLAIARALKAS